MLAADKKHQQEQFEQQQKAHDDWESQRSAFRPTDSEMARWLDYDKAYIKTLALERFNLRNRDIIGYFALMQAAVGCQKARVLYGPPRYSAYQIRLFLLTERGVREYSTLLDLVTGNVHNPQTKNLSYESIVSTEVAEVSVQFADDGRRTMEKLDDASRGMRRDQYKLTVAHALYVTLDNGSPIFALIENFDAGLIDRAIENPEHLDELSRDANGVTGALRILEAIAVERGHWIEEERKRRRRRFDAYREKQQRRRRELGPGFGGGLELPPGQ